RYPRPCRAGKRQRRLSTRAAELGARGRPPAGVGRAERGDEEVGQLGRHPGGADGGRRNLRDELRDDAGAALDLRLSPRIGAQPGCRGLPLRALKKTARAVEGLLTPLTRIRLDPISLSPPAIGEAR